MLWINRRFLNIFNKILLFRYYLPLEKGMAFYLNKLESPLPKDALCQVWLKLVKWFWSRRFFNIFNNYYIFAIISPGKRASPFIWRILNPLHARMLCAKFGWNYPSGSGKEVENVKSLQTDKRTNGQTDRQTTDKKWSEKLIWAFSELKKTV